MKKFIRIKSAGLIDVLAFSLIGASVKQDDDRPKIGKYGSGNKYAIASLIRNNVSFRVFSGKEEIKFTTTPTVFKGETFEVICINGKETSMTTNMGGADWDNMFAPIREIYSNALDEDAGATLDNIDLARPTPGCTSFFIECNEQTSDFYTNLGNYFTMNRKDALESNEEITIYPATMDGLRLFRKGILCFFDPKQKSLFNYDAPEFPINESRVLVGDWRMRWIISKGWAQCKDPDMIKLLMAGMKNPAYLEHRLDFEFATFSEAWKTAVEDVKVMPEEHAGIFSPEDQASSLMVPFNLLKAIKVTHKSVKIMGMDGGEEPFNPNVHTDDTIKEKVCEALNLLRGTPYLKRLGEPDIKFVTFAKPDTWAQAVKGKILISTKIDVKSVEEIAKIIIEEQEHLITEYNDCTRLFQDHLFDLYFESLKEISKLKAKMKAQIDAL